MRRRGAPAGRRPARKNEGTNLDATSFDAYNDRDGHINVMMQTFKKSKAVTRKQLRSEKRKNKSSNVKRNNNDDHKNNNNKRQQQQQQQPDPKRRKLVNNNNNSDEKKQKKKQQKKLPDIQKYEPDLFETRDESDIEDDFSDSDNNSSGNPFLMFNYDSDESDIIDDIAPLEEDEQHKRTKRIHNVEGADLDDDGIIRVDDEFNRVVEEKDKLDDRIIADLEKKLGIFKKKEKERAEKNAKYAKESTTTSGGELAKFVKEKREQKKKQKQQKEQQRNESDDEEEEEANSDEGGDEETNDEDIESSDEWNDGLDGLLDNLDEEEGDDFATFNADAAQDEVDEDDLKELIGDIGDDIEDLNDSLMDFDEADEVNHDSDDDEEGEEGDEEQDQHAKTERKAIIPTTAGASTAGKYLPPHLRKQQSTSTTVVDSRENDARYIALKKSFRSLLNKIAIENIEQITNEALSLYNVNSKNDFHKILADTIIDSICDTVNLQSQFVLVYASFIVSLHNIASVDIGSYFLERLILKFDQERNNRQAATNLLTMICHIFNLGLVYSNLICDVIKVLLADTEKSVSELSIELIYKLLKVCGFQLRQDDPMALKNIIQFVQDTVNAAASTTSTGRFKYLLEFINEVKNNRKKKEGEQEYEKYKNMRRIVKGMQRKHEKSGENTLRIPYDDLLNADTKGRWWIVGSAWIGRDSKSQSAPVSGVPSGLKFADNLKNALEGISEKKIAKLSELAKVQRMTTEMRKTIFYCIMASEDYMDAFQRLLKLNVRKNDREITRVLVHCCCQEKQFNQYYAVLAHELTKVHRSVALSFQYTFFELFKELNDLQIRKVVNLSQLVAYLIGHNALSLSVLKVVDFDNIIKQEIIFYRLLFIHLLLDYDDNTIVNLCLRIVKVRHCDTLRESLQLFLLQFIKKEFRRSFINELLTVKDISKKNDKKWLKQQGRTVRKRAKAMKKILAIDPMMDREDDNDEEFTK